MGPEAMIIVGYVAGALTTISFIPQFIKAWKTKSTRDISLGMFLIFTIGVLLWLLYGILRGDLPIITANVITLSLASGILAMKLKYG